MTLAPSPNPHPQFEDFEQQRVSYAQGMWLFLATEILFFGGLFTGYIVYRALYPSSFHHGSRELHLWLGVLNTAILLLSSMTMALAVRAIQLGRGRDCAKLLAATLLLGCAFLAVKAVEYRKEYLALRVPGLNFAAPPDAPPNLELFFSFYFVMTGLHALHMLIGIGVCALMACLAWRGKYHAEHHAPIEMTGLYWHFVDIVWIFILPLLYLAGHPK